MNEKRHSVFISSTYEDLKEARLAAQDAIIISVDFPVQMEYFPASDEKAFDLIKNLLDKCDYYILIIAGRYGSVAEDGLSYTHKEFRYAVEQGIPVLVMLHGDRGKISADRSEGSEDGKARLEAFITEASTGRTRKNWTTPDDLKNQVFSALAHAKLMKPRVGWVRGDTVASLDALKQLNDVRKENAEFRDALSHSEVEIHLARLPEIESQIDIDFLPAAKNRGSSGTIKTTWMAIFPLLYDNIRCNEDQYSGGYYISENSTCIDFASALLQEISDEYTRYSFRISTTTLKMLTIYFIEAGLMLPEGGTSLFTDFAHKVARRQRFAESISPRFILHRGKIDPVQNLPEHPKSISIDDEIPF